MNVTSTQIVLMGHPRPVGERPAADVVLSHVYIERGHHFLQPYKGQRWLSNSTFQAIIRNEPDSAWCVARLLLEGERILSLQATPARPRVINSCGFAECVNVNHWRPRAIEQLNPYNIVSTPTGWLLCTGNDAVLKDRVVPARIGTEPTVHALRTWHDVDHTVFVTACKLSPDPGLLVIEDGLLANCEACIR